MRLAHAHADERFALLVDHPAGRHALFARLAFALGRVVHLHEAAVDVELQRSGLQQCGHGLGHGLRLNVGRHRVRLDVGHDVLNAVIT